MVTLTLSTPTAPDEVLSTDNAKGSEFIENIVAAYRGPVDGTDEEKTAFVMSQIRKWMVDVNHGQKKKVGREQSDATVDATKTDFS
jgi:hypothetical protein